MIKVPFQIGNFWYLIWPIDRNQSWWHWFPALLARPFILTSITALLRSSPPPSPPYSCSSECDLTNDANVKWEERRDILDPLYWMHLQMYLRETLLYCYVFSGANLKLWTFSLLAVVFGVCLFFSEWISEGNNLLRLNYFPYTLWTKKIHYKSNSKWWGSFERNTTHIFRRNVRI